MKEIKDKKMDRKFIPIIEKEGNKEMLVIEIKKTMCHHMSEIFYGFLSTIRN